MGELILCVVCGLILFLAAVLVFKDYVIRLLEVCSLAHPTDYLAHFLTCFAGAIFFFIFLEKFNCGRGQSLFIAIVLIMLVSLFKEFYLDSAVSGMDIASNLLGLAAAITLLHLYF